MALKINNEKNNEMSEKISKCISAVNTLNRKIQSLEEKTEILERQNSEYVSRIEELEKRIAELEKSSSDTELSKLKEKIEFIYDMENSERVSKYLEKMKKVSEKAEFFASLGDDSFQEDVKDLQMKGLKEEFGFDSGEQAENYVKSSSQAYKQEIRKLESVIDTPIQNVRDFEFDETDDGLIVKQYKGDEKKVSIPNAVNGKPVTEIGAEAFMNCKNLKEIILPENLKRIGFSAFFGTALERVKLPEGTSDIYSNAFNTSSLGQISIPDTVEYIADNAFCRKQFFGYGVTIYCNSGTYAEKYAEKRVIKARPINDFDTML